MKHWQNNENCVSWRKYWFLRKFNKSCQNIVGKSFCQKTVVHKCKIWSGKNPTLEIFMGKIESLSTLGTLSDCQILKTSCLVLKSCMCLLLGPSYTALKTTLGVMQILNFLGSWLPWQQGAVRGKFKWNHQTTQLPKPLFSTNILHVSFTGTELYRCKVSVGDNVNFSNF